MTILPAPRVSSCLALLPVLTCAAPVLAADAGDTTPATEGNQIVVFGGISILDASKEESYRFSEGPDLPGLSRLTRAFPSRRVPRSPARSLVSLQDEGVTGKILPSLKCCGHSRFVIPQP